MLSVDGFKHHLGMIEHETKMYGVYKHETSLESVEKSKMILLSNFIELNQEIEKYEKRFERQFKILDKLREENKELKIEFEKLFDNWALGNLNDTRFFVEYQKMIHKIQQS